MPDHLPPSPIAGELTSSLRRIIAHYETDERCIAMYLWGSLADGSADEHSDVDVAAVFSDDAYPAVRDALRADCEKLCGPITVWLPEGERSDRGNYAFLFEQNGHNYLYDFTIMSASALRRSGAHGARVIFDRTGIIASLPAGDGPARFNEPIAGVIDKYWVYAFLHGKYGLRGDLYKMLYVQSVLFGTHMRVLNALHPERVWRWWGRDAGRLDDQRRRELTAYFGASSVTDIVNALPGIFDLFSRDARTACARKAAYPDALESAVRRHLAECIHAHT